MDAKSEFLPYFTFIVYFILHEITLFAYMYTVILGCHNQFMRHASSRKRGNVKDLLTYYTLVDIKQQTLLVSLIIETFYQ